MDISWPPFSSGKLRRNVVTLLATIAYQMAHGVVTARSQIEASLDADPMTFHQSVDAQLAKFIVEHLCHLRSTGFNFKDSPFFIIIDRLAEYQGNNPQSGFVKSLMAALHLSPVRIRILIASRPEIYLQSAFTSSSILPALSPLTSHLPGLPLMSFVRPIYLCFNDNQIYRRRPQTASTLSPRCHSHLAVF